MNKTLCVIAIVIAIPESVLADGLIFQLPADDTWVKYSGELSAEFKPKASPENEWKKVRGAIEIRICSDGIVTRAQRPCRWIEINMRSWVNGNKDPVGENDLRVLVPERYLTRGEDTLNQAILSQWNPKDADRLGIKDEPGFDRITYEIDRFLISFPPPLANERQLPPETIETSLGAYKDCEVITGTTHFDRPTKDHGRWEVCIRWKIALHSKAPFGVVRIEVEESEGVEISKGGGELKVRGRSVMTLCEIGDSVKSWLPEEDKSGR